MCKDAANWSDQLPLILLGLRSVLKKDINASAAELTYGTNLRLPSEIFSPSKEVPRSEFVVTIKEAMNDIWPAESKPHGKTPPFIHGALQTSTHAYVRRDAVKLSLQTPYEGPYEIATKRPKYFTILVRGTRKNISIDRLKPAFFLPEEDARPVNQKPTSKTTVKRAATSDAGTKTAADPKTTRSGRKY